MNCHFIQLLIVLNFTFLGFFANGSESVNMYFEPSLAVCKKNESSFMDCHSVAQTGIEEIKIALENTAIVNEIEIWSGDHVIELQDDAFQASFQTQVTLQRSKTSNEKVYEFIFLLKNSLSGASKFTVIVNDPAQLNLTHIQLPEIKDGDRIFFLSLIYGASNASVQNTLNFLK